MQYQNSKAVNGLKQKLGMERELKL
jgi:hypothetical protein